MALGTIGGFGGQRPSPQEQDTGLFGTGFTGIGDMLGMNGEDARSAMKRQMFLNGFRTQIGSIPQFGEGVQQAMAQGFQMKRANEQDAIAAEDRQQAEETRRQAAEALKQVLPPNLHTLADASPDTALMIWKQLNPGSDAQPLMNAGGGQIYDPNTGEWITAPNPIGPDTVINNNMGATDSFYDQLDKNLATQTGELINAGMNAQSNNIRLGELEQLLATAPQGMEGGFVQMAGSFGIPTEGVDEVQAAQALINQMVPGQRPPGSGTMSDADLALFKASLPQIMNQPGGNQMILSTMKAINEYTIAQAQIAQAVANRQITPAEGRAMAAQVPNPLADMKPTSPSGGSANDPLGIRG